MPVIYAVSDCRNSRDDKYLELAISGESDVIVTDDSNPPELHPFRDIAIQTPADYLASS